MKKYFLIPFFSLFIILLFPFYSSANYLPPVDPNTTQIPGFLQTVAQTQIANDTGVYSPYKPDLNSINQIVNGRTIDNSMVEVYIDNDALLNDYVFYDSNGNSVPASNTFTAFGTSDVGNYTYVADKTTGEILGYAGRNDDIVSTLQAGGTTADFPTVVQNAISLAGGGSGVNTLIQAYSDASERESLAVYDSSDLSTSELQFIENNDFHMYAHSNTMGWTVYVPNTCSNSCIVSDLNGIYSYSGFVDPNDFLGCPNIFTNNPGAITFSGGNSGNYGYLKPEGHYYFGIDFQFVSSWFQTYNPLGFPTGGYLDFRAPTYSEFQTYNSISDKYRVVRPVTVQGDTTQNYYNYTYVTENPPEYVTNINNNYVYSDPTTPDNYPFNTNVTLPNYETDNNYITNIYNYYSTPNINGGNAGSITDPVLPENIPILSNLEYRFPFSIPFDMYKLAKGLSVPRETPYIDTVIVIPGINYEWTLQYDLHSFDNVAELFRLLELILFIVALALFSYDHFFGS